MDPLTRTLTLGFLIATMAAIGLKVTISEIVTALGSRGLMVRSLAVNLVLVPVIGLLLVTLVPLSRDARAGILLLAAAPGGLNAIQFTSKSRDALCYAAALLFILSVLAVLLSPAIAALALSLDTPLVLPYGRVIRILLLYFLLPLAAGLAVHRVSEPAARLLSTPVGLCGTVLFVVVIFRLMAQRKEAMTAMSTIELAAMVGFILLTMVVGWLCGGPSVHTRRVLATTTSMRNAGLCLLIVIHSFPGTDVIVTVVAFSALMIPPNMLLTVYTAIKERKSSGR
jgi:BASS family bile acid:Na+ symporter